MGGSSPDITTRRFISMKRGKKYQDAAKSFDRAAQYDVAEAIGIVKKNAMQSSRFVAQLYCRTELVRL